MTSASSLDVTLELACASGTPSPVPVDPSPSTSDNLALISTFPRVGVTPESVRPYPKAKPRTSGRGRKRQYASLMTEDPEVYADMKEKEEKRKRKSEGTGKRGRPKKSRPVRAVHDSSEDEEGVQNVPLNDSSEYSDEQPETDEVQPMSDFVSKEPEVGDYVVLELDIEEGRFKGKRKLHFVGMVEEVGSTGSLKIKYLRLTSQCGNFTNFHFPKVQDTEEVQREKVLGVLHKPITGSTSRLTSLLRFPALRGYNLQ